jgi:ABC-2 type transport system ATP-binding protein
MNAVIEINDLTCAYGQTEVVRHLSLQVPEGSTYAFLGTNGAGKTTTIKTLLNLLPPSSGTVKVLGTPVAQLGPKELAQIGYLSGDQKLPETLTVKHLIAYSRALYPTWDDAFCQRLSQTLALPLDRKVAHLSTGMKVKTALLLALAFRPRLLILDEPFSGLDPLVRDELIQSLQEVFSQQKWSMFISSHDIGEVELLADWVGILDQGRLCLSESWEKLYARFRRVDIILPGNADLKHQLTPEGLLFEAAGATAKWIESHFISTEATATRIRERYPAETAVSVSPMSLREIFVAVTRCLRQNPQAVL